MLDSFVRIAQLLIIPTPEFRVIEAVELPETKRGIAGLGSTGL
jgi:dUTPase